MSEDVERRMLVVLSGVITGATVLVIVGQARVVSGLAAVSALVICSLALSVAALAVTPPRDNEER